MNHTCSIDLKVASLAKPDLGEIDWSSHISIRSSQLPKLGARTSYLRLAGLVRSILKIDRIVGDLDCQCI